MPDHDPLAGARAYLEKGFSLGELDARSIIRDLIAEIEALRLPVRVNSHVGRRFEFRQGQMRERLAAMDAGALREDLP